MCNAFYAFYESPRCAAVYNLGGGRENSVSILEAIERFTDLFGQPLKTEYVDQNRVGDHICYISDLRRFQSDYPGWSLEISLDEIMEKFVTLPAKELLTATSKR